MTTHSSDAPMVTLFSNTSTQWCNTIHAIVDVSRFRKTLSLSACQQGLGGLENLQSTKPQTQHGSWSEGESRQNEETNQAATEALDRALGDTNPEVEVVKLIRDELVKQLDTYGIVLVLLAGITFLGILQPPGSFVDGKLQESLLVSLFMLLASLSFFTACTGLGAVMVGCAVLFRPFFHTKLAMYTDVSSKSRPGISPLENSLARESPARHGFRNAGLFGGCLEVGTNDVVAVDDVKLLAELCVENVYRIRRIRIYLGVALVLCIAAYICGALAVMVTSDRQRYLIIGAVGGGGVIVLYEICITLYAYWSRGWWWCHTAVQEMHHPVRMDRSQQPTVVPATEFAPAIADGSCTVNRDEETQP